MCFAFCLCVCPGGGGGGGGGWKLPLQHAAMPCLKCICMYVIKEGHCYSHHHWRTCALFLKRTSLLQMSNHASRCIYTRPSVVPPPYPYSVISQLVTGCDANESLISLCDPGWLEPAGQMYSTNDDWRIVSSVYPLHPHLSSHSSLT